MSERSERQRWIAVLAKAEPTELARLWAALPDKPGWRRLRVPETGMAMVRGRAGGTGQPFNLGEMTVTRCAVQLADGTAGYGYVGGTDREHAELAAVIDAMMQVPARRAAAEQAIVEPLAAARAATRRETAAKTAATRVEFFTLVRGED
ncbi:MAG: phosphonate C-P lyase system protein PhnG [Candidatus Eiseniibacteriota bacterium]